MEALQRDLKLVEESHGNQVLNVVLARGYLSKLIANSRIVRYLGHHADIFREVQAVCEGSSLENQISSTVESLRNSNPTYRPSKTWQNRGRLLYFWRRFQLPQIYI
jgi:hypothetical protein